MQPTRHLILVSVTLLSSALGCDSNKSKGPAPEPVAPPLEAPRAPGSAAAPTQPPAPLTPPRFAKAAPDGIVIDSWLAGGRCNLEFVNGPAGNAPVSLKLGSPVKLSGWGFDVANKKVADSIHVRLAAKDGAQYFVTTRTVVPREDVAKAEKLPADQLNSGFEVVAETAELAAGDYAVTLLIRSGMKTYICDNGRRIQIAP